MVRAILDGRKTQTRRVVKEPIDFLGAGGNKGVDWNDPKYWGWEDPERPGHFGVLGRNPDPGDWSIRCPYGRVGDRLWVKEPHLRWTGCHNAPDDWIRPPEGITGQAIAYLDNQDALAFHDKAAAAIIISSIHMPRWASRITLEITDILVIRAMEISEEDAALERIGRIKNQWLWAITFRRVEA
jgi:hypothetical protein